MGKISITPTKAVAMLNPGMTVLVSCKKEEKDNIITITWQTMLSSNPPTVGISVAPQRYSYEMIMNSGEYVINIPNANLLKEVHYCGTASGRQVDKFAETGLTKVPAEIVNVPLIEECVGNVECQVVSTHPAGAHTIFVAKIVAVKVEESLYHNGAWLTGAGALESLHYLGGTKYAVLGQTLDAKNVRQ